MEISFGFSLFKMGLGLWGGVLLFLSLLFFLYEPDLALKALLSLTECLERELFLGVEGSPE